MAVFEVHVSDWIDPTGKGVIGLSHKVFSDEAKAWKANLWLERGKARREELTSVRGATG